MGHSAEHASRTARPGHRRDRCTAAVAVLALVLGAALAWAAPASAEPAPADADTPTLAEAMGGELDTVAATAAGGFEGRDTLVVHVQVSNRGQAPARLRLPRGMLFATDDDSHQIAVTSGPLAETPELARFGADPVLVVPPGASTVDLQAYCAQRGDQGPNETTPMHAAGVAGEPLPTVLANAVAAKADPEVTQQAVWWATDSPQVPVPTEIAHLFDGVDTATFAAEPTQVVPDDAYVPLWAREGDAGVVSPLDPTRSTGAGGVATFVILLVVAVAVAVITFSIVSTRPRRSATVPVRPPGPPARPVPPGAGASHAPSPPGWYPNPSGGGGLRWWDGSRWTDHRGPS